MATYFLLRLAGVAMPRLPEALGRRLFEWVGMLTWYFASRSREAVQQNLIRVLPGARKEEIRKLSKEVFRHCLLNYYDLLSRRSSKTELRDTHIWGEDNLKAAQGIGKGIIIATAHLGSWNLILKMAAVHSWKGVVLTETLQIKGMNRLINSLRSTNHIKALSANVAGLKEAFRALNRGELVVVACDRAIQGSGVRVPFMGEEALLPDGAVELAARTGATILPAFCPRDDHRNIKLYFDSPFVISEREAGAYSKSEGLAKIIETMERYIRRYPEQWMVFSPIWRNRAIG